MFEKLSALCFCFHFVVQIPMVRKTLKNSFDFLLLMQTHKKQVFSKREKKLCAFKEGKFVMFRLIVQQTKIASVCFFHSQKPSSSPPPLLSRSKMAKNLAFLYKQCSNCIFVVKKMPSMHLSMFECKKY